MNIYDWMNLNATVDFKIILTWAVVYLNISLICEIWSHGLVFLSKRITDFFEILLVLRLNKASVSNPFSKTQTALTENEGSLFFSELIQSFSTLDNELPHSLICIFYWNVLSSNICLNTECSARLVQSSSISLYSRWVFGRDCDRWNDTSCTHWGKLHHLEFLLPKLYSSI